MAQSFCNISNTIIPIQKTSSTTKNGYFHVHPTSPQLGLLKRVTNSQNITKAMKAERRENLDFLQRPALNKRQATTSIPIGVWERFPARTVQQMIDTMDRMVADPSAYNSTRWPSPLPNDGSGYAKGRTPWDIKEGDTAYKLRFDMPGMTKNDVKIWVEEKMLVIKAEKLARKKDGEQNGGLVEDEEDWPAKSYGTYSSRIALPENVKFEKIKAEVRDGVLYLTIPKPSVKTKIFDINVQ